MLIKGLALEGVGCPADVAIIGFDGLDLCELITPPLTTVAQPVSYNFV